jgi:hypothetical protein
VGTMPAFYTDIDSPRYGDDGAAVYHDEIACWRGQRILEDHAEVFGRGGRRHCPECERRASHERETPVEREARVRGDLQVGGLGLLRRDDGFYHVTDHGMVIAPNDWRVKSTEMNDRGGDRGDAYPLTLGWIEHWIRGGMGQSPL